MTNGILSWVSRNLRQGSLQDGEVTSSVFAEVKKGPVAMAGVGRAVSAAAGSGRHMGQGDGAGREDSLFQGYRPGCGASRGGVPGRQLEKQTPTRLSSRPWVSGQGTEPAMQPLAGVGSDRNGGETEDTST